MTELDSLLELALDSSRERITISEMVHVMGDCSLATLILLFALPNSIPAPPGTSAILGVPLLFLTTQMALGHSASLPQWLARQSFSRKHLADLMLQLDAISRRAERICKPRLHTYAGPFAMRVAGGIGVLVSVILILPLPLVNVPCGVALVLVSLGCLYKDGLFTILGCVAGFASLILAVVVVVLSWHIVHKALSVIL
ncbi:MAG: exopolysaccharide biosynthesis protein [Pseudomonadota bacterium]